MSQIPDATQDMLNVFVGKWINHPENDGESLSGSTRYLWDMDDRWLLFESRLQLPNMPDYEVRGGVSFIADKGSYIAFAYNNMQSLISYDGYWQDNATLVFESTHPGARAQARIIYVIHPDGSITMQSQKRLDSGEYNTYFSTRMTPVNQ